mmetsp:Transcript_19826/g.42894  ORF Transcript_19826/g.42894 Transcript_19826/m.42894 type:complete len:419 (-) Transcript_19826:133-1389(-)
MATLRSWSQFEYESPPLPPTLLASRPFDPLSLRPPPALVTAHVDVCRCLMQMRGDDRRHQHVVNLLADHSKNLDLMDRDGRSVLATTCIYLQLDYLRILLSKDPPPSVALVDNDGSAPLHLVASLPRTRDMHHGCAALEMLIAAGANVNEPDKQGLTALHLAAARGRSDLLTALLAHGADVNIQDVSGRTAAQVAAQYGFKAEVDALGLAGAEVKDEDSADIPVEFASLADPTAARLPPPLATLPEAVRRKAQETNPHRLRVMCMDYEGEWYLCQLVRVQFAPFSEDEYHQVLRQERAESATCRLLIHYEGWTDRWNEWLVLPQESNRLRMRMPGEGCTGSRGVGPRLEPPVTVWDDTKGWTDGHLVGVAGVVLFFGPGLVNDTASDIVRIDTSSFERLKESLHVKGDEGGMLVKAAR